ncbi:hypothetical protein SAY87_005196 [Trapa incisa]|uniref:Uncharacterized protein n=1 Tax=Trapa incisa TaxID=236973 RepID=A0AAN7K2I2_9MYRT|nr:hypothetical protein SAY87_005196 [Trapa incisa]
MATEFKAAAEPVPPLEHSSEKLDQIGNEFSRGGEDKSDVELHQPLQGMGEMDSLRNLSTCNSEESKQVVGDYQGKGRAPVGESFSELSPAAKVAIEQNEAGEVRPEAENEMKHPGKDLTGGGDGLKEQGGMISCIEERMESKFLLETEEPELVVKEIELEKFGLKYTEKNLSKIDGAKDGATLVHNIDAKQNLIELDDEMKGDKVAEDEEESKIEPAGFSISTETNFEAPTEMKDSITVVADSPVNGSGDSMGQEEESDIFTLKMTAAVDSYTAGKDAEVSTELNKLGTKKPEDCILSAINELPEFEAVLTTNEEIPTIDQCFQQEEAREKRDEHIWQLAGEEETVTGEALEIKTEKVHEVPSCKPGEQVTEKDESPLLTEKQTGDAYGARKNIEIPAAIYPTIEENLSIEEESPLKHEAGNMEIERLKEFTDLKPQEPVGEGGETYTATEIKARNELKDILIIEGVKVESQPVEMIIIEKHETEVASIEEEEPTLQEETRDEGEMSPDKGVDHTNAGNLAQDMNLQLVGESDQVNNGVNADESDKLHDIPSILSMEKATEENEAPTTMEKRTGDIFEENESKEIAIQEHSCMEKENVPSIQEEDPLKSGVDDAKAEKVNDVPSFKIEDCVHEEHGVHEVKESPVKEITEARETIEITTAETSSIEQNIPLSGGANQLQSQADHMESEMLNEVPDFKTREQVSEDGEASTVVETMDEDESNASRDAEQTLHRDPSKEKDMPLFEEENVEAVSEHIIGEEYEQEVQVIKEDAHFIQEAQDEDDSKDLLQIDEVNQLNNGESDTEAQKHDEILIFGCNEQTGNENEAPLSVEILKEDSTETKESVSADPSTAKQSLPLIQEAGEHSAIVDHTGTEKLNDGTNFKMEELIHEEIEGHKVKEMQAEDKNEESGLEEIIIAGCSFSGKQNQPLMSQAEDLKIESAEKLNEISSSNCKKEAEQESETLSLEVIITKQPSVEKVHDDETRMKSATVYITDQDETNEDTDVQTISQGVTTILEHEKQCEQTAEAIHSAEKVSIEEVHDAEILIRSAIVDITDPDEASGVKVTESSSDQHWKINDGRCEEPRNDALNNFRSLTLISEDENIIFEESTSSMKLVGKLEKDKLENVPVDSKPHALVEVNYSADAEISCASEPAHENQSSAAFPEIEEGTFQKPDESPTADDVHGVTYQECNSTVMVGIDTSDKMGSITETERQETVDETRDVAELTKEHENVEENKNDEEVKMQDNVNLELPSATEAREEECFNEKDGQMNVAPVPEVEVGESIHETLQVEYGSNVHSNEETRKPEAQEKDGEIAQQFMSETEVLELSTELEDANKQKTSDEEISSFEQEKQCEKLDRADDSIAEKASTEEVDDGEGKTHRSESLEEQVIDEVIDSKEIHSLTLVESTIVEETYIGPGLDGMKVEVENTHIQEIAAGRIRREAINVDLGKEEMQEQESVSILETEDGSEDLLTMLSQQPEHDSAKREEAIQDPNDEHKGSKTALEETFASKNQGNEIIDAVEGTFEENMSQLTGTPGKIDRTPREMEVSDSRCLGPISVEETHLNQSRELASQILTLVPTVIPETEESKTATMVKNTEEENKTSVQQNENMVLSFAIEVTKFEQQKTLHGDTEPNEGREDISNEVGEDANEGGNLEQEPTKKETRTEDLEPSIGEERINIGNSSDISFFRMEAKQEASHEVQIEGELELENSESQNLSAEEVTVEANRQYKDSVRAEDIAQHQALDENERISGMVSAAVKDGLTIEEEEVLTDKNDLSTEEEQITLGNESLEISSAAEVAREECHEKDEQIEKVAVSDTETKEDTENEEDDDQSTSVEALKLEPQGNEREREYAESTSITGKVSSESTLETEKTTDLTSHKNETSGLVKFETQVRESFGSKDSEIRSLVFEEETIGGSKEYGNTVRADDITKYDIPNEKDDSGDGKCQGSERGEVMKATHEFSSEDLSVSEERDSGTIVVESNFENETIPRAKSAPGSDDGQKLFIDALVEDVQEDVKEVYDKEDASHEDINAASQAKKATSINSTEVELYDPKDIHEQENFEKDEVPVQDLDEEHEGSNAALEEACSSKQPDTKVTNAVEGTFEEEKSEQTGITGELDGIFVKMEGSDSQCKESVSMGETNSDESRNFESQALALVPTVLQETGENGSDALAETTKEDKESVQQDENMDLSSLGEMAKVKEQQKTVHRSTESNEGQKNVSNEVDEEVAAEGGGLGHELPLTEEIKMDHVDSWTGEESTETDNATDVSLRRIEIIHGASSQIQMEEKIVNVEESIIKANEHSEYIAEAKDISQHQMSDYKKHHGEEHDDAIETIIPGMEKDGVHEERDCGIVPGESIFENEVISIAKIASHSNDEQRTVLDALADEHIKEVYDKEGTINEDSNAASMAIEATVVEQDEPEYFLKEKVEEHVTFSVLKNEDAREGNSPNPMNQESIHEQENAEKEAAQDPDEDKGSNAAIEEACSSKRPDTELTNAVEGTLEEEKSEQTGITREMDGISVEMEASYSQCRESLSREEINSDNSRELESQPMESVSSVIPEIGENETGAIIETTKEEKKIIVQQDDNLKLSSAGKVAKVEQHQQTVHRNTEANQIGGDVYKVNEVSASEGEDLGQEPSLKEEIKTVCVGSSTGEESIEIDNATDVSLGRLETTEGASSQIQMEEQLMTVEEAIVEANKQSENIAEAKHICQHEISDYKEQHGYGEADAVEIRKHVIEKNEEDDSGTVSAEHKEVEVKDELSTKQLEAILEIHEEQKVELVGLSSDAEVAKEDYIGKDEVSAANEASGDISHQEDDYKGTPIEALELESPKKEGKREYNESPSIIEKSNPELILETETATDLISQKSEIKEQVELETKPEDRTLGSKDSEIRSLPFKDESVDTGKECKHTFRADNIIHDDIQNEKEPMENVCTKEIAAGRIRSKTANEDLRNKEMLEQEKVVPVVIPETGDNETDAIAVTAKEENKASLQQNEKLELSSVEKVEKVADDVHEDTEPNGGRKDASNETGEEGKTESGDLDQEPPLKEEIKTVHVDSSMGEESLETDNATDVSFGMIEESNVEANKQCENITEVNDIAQHEISDYKEHRADGEVDAEITKQVMEKDGVPEDIDKVSSEYKEKTDKEEFSTKEEQSIQERQDEEKVTLVELSSGADVAEKEYIQKDKLTEDEAPSANEATEDISHEEDDDRGTPVHLLDLGLPEKESKRERVESPSTIEKSAPEFISEAVATDVMSQISEMREQVEVEIQTEDRILGSKDYEKRSFVFEEESVKASEQCQKAVGPDDIIQQDTQKEKVGDSGMIPGEGNYENEAISRTEIKYPIRAAGSNIDDGQHIASHALSKDLEEHVEKVTEKKEASYEESNATSLAVEANEINSVEAEQDEPARVSMHETLTSSPDVEEAEIGPRMDGIKVKEDDVQNEEIAAGRIQFEQSDAEQNNSEKGEEVVQYPEGEYGESKTALEETCGSKHRGTEMVDVVTFGEDKPEMTGTPGEIDPTPREREVFGSQCTGSVFMDEANSDKSTNLESQALTPIAAVIPETEKNETDALVETLKEENKTSVQQEENLGLSSAEEVAKVKEEQKSARDTEANEGREDLSIEANKEGATEGGDLGQDQPLTEEIKIVYVDYSTGGGESIETDNATYAPLGSIQTKGASYQIQEKDTNAEEAIIETNKYSENIAEAEDIVQHEIISDCKEHDEDGEVDAIEVMKQVTEKDSVPEEKDFGTVSAEHKEEEEKDELSGKNEQAIPEVHDEHKLHLVELSSGAEIAQREYLKNDEQIEYEEPAAKSTGDVSNEEDDDRGTLVEALELEPPEKESTREFTESSKKTEQGPELTFKTETASDLMPQKSEIGEQHKLETLTEDRTQGSKDSEIRCLIFEETTLKDDSGQEKAHESESGNDGQATCEISHENLATSKDGDSSAIHGETNLEIGRISGIESASSIEIGDASIDDEVSEANDASEVISNEEDEDLNLEPPAKDSKTENAASPSETEAAREYENADGAEDIIQDDIPNEKDYGADRSTPDPESEVSVDVKATHETLVENIATCKEGDSSIILGESKLESEAIMGSKSAPPDRAEVKNVDGESIHSEKADMLYEDSSAESLVTEAIEINSMEAKQDKPTNESASEIMEELMVREERSASPDAIESNVDPKSHSDNTLEASDIETDESPDETSPDKPGKDDGSTSIKEEVIEKGCTKEEIHIATAYKEGDADLVPAEEIAAKDLDEPKMNDAGKSESSTTEILESDTAQNEQISTPIKEIRQLEHVTEEVQEEAITYSVKIDPEPPKISLQEVQKDQKAVEQTNILFEKGSKEIATSENKLGGEECIEKDGEIEYKVSEANKAKEDISHEEEDGRTTPAGALKLELMEKDSETECAESPSRVKKSSELIIESKTTTGLISQKSEITEQNQFETKFEENPSLICKEEPSGASKVYVDAARGDDIIQDDIPNEKDNSELAQAHHESQCSEDLKAMNEEERDAYEKAGENANIKVEVIEKGCMTEEIPEAYKEGESTSALAKDAVTKDLDDKIIEANFEDEANETINGEFPSITDVLESDIAHDVSLMEDVKDAKKEISEDANNCREKIGSEVKEISSQESQPDEKPVEKSDIIPEKESHVTAEERPGIEEEGCIGKGEKIEEVESTSNEATKDIICKEDEDQGTPVEIPKLETPEKDGKKENLAINEEEDSAIAPGERNLEKGANQLIKIAPSAQEEIRMDGQKIVSDAIDENAEEHLDAAPEKAYMSFEESTAASTATQAAEINLKKDDKDEPVKKSSHEMLTGLLAVEVRSMSSDEMERNIDSKSLFNIALEAYDMNRDESLHDEMDNAHGEVGEGTNMEEEMIEKRCNKEDMHGAHKESDPSSVTVEDFAEDLGEQILMGTFEPPEEIRKHESSIANVLESHRTQEDQVNIPVEEVSQMKDREEGVQKDTPLEKIDTKIPEISSQEAHYDQIDNTLEVLRAHGKASDSTNIEDEVIEKGCSTQEIHAEYKEKESTSSPTEDVITKDLDDKIVVENSEWESNKASKSVLTIADIFESNITHEEQIITPKEEMKEVHDVEDEILKEDNAPLENIGLEKKPLETAESETRLEEEICMQKNESIDDVFLATSEAAEDIKHEEIEDQNTPVAAPKLDAPEKDTKIKALATSEEGDSDMIPGGISLESEEVQGDNTAPFLRVAGMKIDDGQVSDAIAKDTEELVKKFSEKAEMSYEENNAPSMDVEETGTNSAEIDEDEAVKECMHGALAGLVASEESMNLDAIKNNNDPLDQSQNVSEVKNAKRDRVLDEEKYYVHGKYGENASIEEGLTEKGFIEEEIHSVHKDVDISAEDPEEQILDENFEHQPNETSSSVLSVETVLEKNSTQVEQTSALMEEMKEVKDVDEVQEDNDIHSENIDPVIPEIILQEAQKDPKPEEKSTIGIEKGSQETAATEAGYGGQECIKKEEKIDDIVSEAYEAEVNIPHDEYEDRSSLLEAQKLEPLEKGSKTEHAESNSMLEKNLELTTEAGITTDLMSRESVISNKVELETKFEEKPSLIFKEETFAASKEHKNDAETDDIVQDGIPNEKDESGLAQTRESEHSEGGKEPQEIPSENLATKEEESSSIFPREGNMETDAIPRDESPSSVKAADANIDDRLEIASDVPAEETEMEVEEVYEKAEVPYIESNVAGLSTTEKDITSKEDEPAKRSTHGSLTGTQDHDTHGKAAESTSIGEELVEKHCITEDIHAVHKERASTLILSEDIAPKDLDEKILVRSFELEASSKSESHILKSSTTQNEQISALVEEMTEVKYVQKEIQTDVDDQGDKISVKLPGISLQEVQQDQKFAEKSNICLEESWKTVVVEIALSREESISKDKEMEDINSAANEAPVSIPHEEDDDRGTPFDALKAEPVEKDGKSKYELPPTTGKSSDSTLETERTASLVSQKSEIREQVELENPSEEKTLGSEDSANRSLIFEEEKVEDSKESQNDSTPDGIIQNEELVSQKAEMSCEERSDCTSVQPENIAAENLRRCSSALEGDVAEDEHILYIPVEEMKGVEKNQEEAAPCENVGHEESEISLMEAQQGKEPEGLSAVGLEERSCGGTAETEARLADKDSEEAPPTVCLIADVRKGSQTPYVSSKYSTSPVKATDVIVEATGNDTNVAGSRLDDGAIFEETSLSESLYSREVHSVGTDSVHSVSSSELEMQPAATLSEFPLEVGTTDAAYATVQFEETTKEMEILHYENLQSISSPQTGEVVFLGEAGDVTMKAVESASYTSLGNKTLADSIFREEKQESGKLHPAEEQPTKEIHREDKPKDEKGVEEKPGALVSTNDELQKQEDVKERSIDGVAGNEPDMVLVEEQETKKSRPHDEEVNAEEVNAEEIVQQISQNEKGETKPENNLTEISNLREEDRCPTLEMAEDIASTEHHEKILVRNFEQEANKTNKYILESNTTKDELLSAHVEEMKAVKYVEKEILGDAEGRGAKTSSAFPEIGLQESQQDQRFAENTYTCLEGSQKITVVEARLGGTKSIDKNEQIEEVSSAADEVPVCIPHEEDDDHCTPLKSIKTEFAEKDGKTEYTEFPPITEKNSEFTLETDMNIKLESQKSEITEQVELETQSEEKTQGPEDSENRSLKVENSKECQNAAGADDIIQNEEVVSQKAETSSEESNAAILTMQAIGSFSAGTEQDEPVKEPAHEILTGLLESKVRTTSSEALAVDADLKRHSEDLLDMKVIESHEILDEEACEAHGKADQGVRIYKEVNKKGFITDGVHAVKEEKDSTSVQAEDFAAKKHYEEILAAGNFEPEANATSQGELSTSKALERDIAEDEYIYTPVEELKELKKVKKKIPEEAFLEWGKKSEELSDIGHEKVSLGTTVTEARFEAKESEEALTTGCPITELSEGSQAASVSSKVSTHPVEATSLVEETTVINLNVAGSKLDSGEIYEEISPLEFFNNKDVPGEDTASEMQPEAPVSASPLEAESTDATKEMELLHVEVLQLTSSSQTRQVVFLGKADEVSMKVDESVPDIDLAHETLVDPTFKEEPVYPFVQEQESGKIHLTVTETTEEIPKEHKLKIEEVIEEKTEILISTVDEIEKLEEVKGRSLDEGMAGKEPDTVFVKEQEIKKSHPHDKEVRVAHEVAELNARDEKSQTNTGNILLAETITMRKQEIEHEDSISTTTPGERDPKERSVCKEVGKMVPIDKEKASTELDETVAATTARPEENISGLKNPHLPKHGGGKVLCASEEKACEEPASTCVLLYDLLKKPETEKLQAKNPIDSLLEPQAEEEAKTDEEMDEHEGDEHESLVLVETSKDIDVKAYHKKSHNILSGVGSKVKHSISKVKKAITGKSSHPKTVSLKKNS